MPSSRPNAIPIIVSLIKQLAPQSILDVGIGFGKWGHLFREYTDILESQDDPPRYRRENWQVRIDGIEGYPDYVTEMHRYIYNNIMIGDLRTLADKIGDYDVIFLGDIIEHVTKQEGIDVLNRLRRKARKAIIISTPKYETGQQALCDNDLETHRSVWSEMDFLAFPNSQVTTVTKTLLIAVLLVNDTPVPRLSAEIAGLPNSFSRRVVRRIRKIVRSFTAIVKPRIAST